MLRPFFIAMQFLTRVPMPALRRSEDRDIGRSLLWYPLVGAIIGLVLAGLQWALHGAPSLLGAALVLAVWVLITGGLHLDGLADSADAWVGGLENRERTLAIMKDPCCGPMGGAALIVVLILKFAALEALLTNGDWLILFVVPILARATLPALFLTTPYVRMNGLGSSLAAHLPRTAAFFTVGIVLVAIPAIAGLPGLWMMLGATAMFFALRALMMRRIGGMTGDTAGATVELVEAAAMVIASLV